MKQQFNQNSHFSCENSTSVFCCSYPKPKNGNITKARRMVLANSIKSARQAKGLKQAVLARKIGCNQATLSRIESGATSVDVDLLIEICLQLEISAPSLLGAMQ
jgi:ribosome-binding protein aMBF1 (putative translation factor)